MVVPCEGSYELDRLLAVYPINFALLDFIRLILYSVSKTNFEASQYSSFLYPPVISFDLGADILRIALFPTALSLPSCEKQRFTPMQSYRSIGSLEELDILYFK
jgi:hypothetical protein